MSGVGQEVATVVEDAAKKVGPALAKDFSGAYQKILHDTADGLEKNAKRVVENEAQIKRDLDAIKPDGSKTAAKLAKKKKPPEDGEGGQKSDGNKKSETGNTDPVDVVSGQVLGDVNDVDLPGLLPLVLRRAYASGYVGGRLFGPGWSGTLDERVEVDDDGIRYFGDDAQIMRYPVPSGGDVFPAAGDRWPLTWDRATGVISIEDPRSGWTRHFGATPNTDGSRPIVAITDRNQHRVSFVHDAAGNPVEVTHSGGYRVGVDTADTDNGPRVTGLRLIGADTVVPLVRFGYDADGRLAETVDSTGVPYRHEYDSAARMTAWVDRDGGRYEYLYDEAGRVVRGTGPDGYLSCTMRYDPARRMTTVTDSLGHSVQYHYDEHRHVVRIVDELGNSTSLDKDPLGRVRSRTDALGNTTRYELNEFGDPTRITLADSTQATVEYNALTQPVRVVGPDGAVWRYEYDERGNVVSTIDPEGATTRYTYDERGMLTDVTDALGNTARVRADSCGLVTEITDPVGRTTRYDRDLFGRPAVIVDQAGVTTRYGWTVEGAPAWREAPDGTRERWTYDAAGNVLSYQDNTGATTSFTYTYCRLATSRTTRDGRRYQFDYDTALRLRSVTDPQGLQWSYEYDAAGRPIAETDFNGRRVTYVTDAAGDLVDKVNGAGQRVRYTRDMFGRTVERRAGDHTTTMSYDGAGRLISATGPESRIDLVRDALGRIISESVDGRAVRTEFDPLGRRVTRVTPSGQVSRWDYDAAGQPVAMATAAGSLRFGYDAAGRETSRSLGPRAIMTQHWDRAGRLAGQSILASERGIAGDPAAALVQQRTYTYRADGDPLRIDDRLRGSRRYTLDTAGRVTAVQAANWSEQYAYDASGNPTWAAASGPLADADASGQRDYEGTLVRRAGRTSYEYDGQGRVVRQIRHTLSGQQRNWHYTWDADDQLTDVVTPDGTRWHYRYDALGRRIAKQRIGQDGAPVEETLFAWDGTVLAEQATATDGPHGTTRTWEYEPGTHRPVAQIDRGLPSDQAGYDAAFYAIVTDLVGSPSELVDRNGNVAWYATTDLWGRTGAGSNGAGIDCPLRFPGQYHDEETGWHYNYSRYYDPSTGRYTSPDPLGLEAAPNQHGYVSNPVSWMDPLGLAGGKSDAEMKADALAIQNTGGWGRAGVGANFALQGTTVATGEFDGRYVYTVNKNQTNPEMERVATNLGYDRITGDGPVKPGETHAEQIMLNAKDNGQLPLQQDQKGRMAVGRAPCQEKRRNGKPGENCAARIAKYTDITLIK